jgi:predicted nucleic acid-binding protein
MVTAVDTNVLLDVFLDDPQYRRASFAALTRAFSSGDVIVCDVVWSETGAAFDDAELTRDNGFYRDYFADLNVVNPL